MFSKLTNCLLVFSAHQHQRKSIYYQNELNQNQSMLYDSKNITYLLVSDGETNKENGVAKDDLYLCLIRN
jgi:hypothetical protein